jgi:glycosyltransferase A (GT-A) superfamily protein (DUF2064 family)
VSGAIAIFVKTPGYSTVKTRLAAAVGSSVAHEWHEPMRRELAALPSPLPAQQALGAWLEETHGAVDRMKETS